MNYFADGNEVFSLPSILAGQTMKENYISDESKSNWSKLKLIGFRFIFTYLVFYNFPEPLGSLKFLSFITKPYDEFWKVICVWVGKVIFSQEITYQFNGSGDTTYDYILLFCYFCLSLIITIIWTLFERKRFNYSRLFQYLSVYVKYVVALTMITYGSRKIIQSQFPAPWLERLLEPYGDSSPMAILWTFMGSSYPFNVFTGMGEMIGGLLLIFKRIRVLGGLILVAVLANIVMLNFSYDVPVKLYSTHLLLMTFFILLPDLRRLFNFFFFNKAVQPEIYQPLFTKPKMNRWLSIFAKTFVVFFIIYSFYLSHEASKMYTTKTEFYGIWNVEEIEMNGTRQEPLLTNGTRWRKVIFEYPDWIPVYLVNEKYVRFLLEVNREEQTFVFTVPKEPNLKTRITYSQPNPDEMILEGTWDEKTFKAKLKRMEKKFLLQERGFHWINEVPYHR